MTAPMRLRPTRLLDAESYTARRQRVAVVGDFGRGGGETADGPSRCHCHLRRRCPERSGSSEWTAWITPVEVSLLGWAGWVARRGSRGMSRSPRASLYSDSLY